jgi:hypothetical protein
MKRLLPAQDPHHIGQRRTPHLAQGFLGESGRVRRDDHVRVPEQLVTGFGRLVGKHVETRPGDGPGAERRGQRSLVHHRAPAGVDEIRLRSHKREGAGAHHVPGVRGEGQMHGQEIRLREQPPR